MTDLPHRCRPSARICRQRPRNRGLSPRRGMPPAASGQVVFGTAAARPTEGRRRSYNKLIKAHTKIVQQLAVHA